MPELQGYHGPAIVPGTLPRNRYTEHLQYFYHAGSLFTKPVDLSRHLRHLDFTNCHHNLRQGIAGAVYNREATTSFATFDTNDRIGVNGQIVTVITATDMRFGSGQYDQFTHSTTEFESFMILSGAPGDVRIWESTGVNIISFTTHDNWGVFGVSVQNLAGNKQVQGYYEGEQDVLSTSQVPNNDITHVLGGTAAGRGWPNTYWGGIWVGDAFTDEEQAEIARTYGGVLLPDYAQPYIGMGIPSGPPVVDPVLAVTFVVS